MAEGQKYLIRDPQGNVYGPADGALLREWVAQGRIVPGMGIAARETREWVGASGHPETAGGRGRRGGGERTSGGGGGDRSAGGGIETGGGRCAGCAGGGGGGGGRSRADGG